MLMLLTVSTFGNVLAQSDDSGIGIDLKRVDNKAEVGLFEDLADAVGVMFTFNQEKRIEKILARADKRLNEISLYAKDDSKKLARSQRIYKNLMKDVDTTLENLDSSEEDSEKILAVYERVEKMLAFHHLKAEGVNEHSLETLKSSGISAKEISDFEVKSEDSRNFRISQFEKIPEKAIENIGKIEPVDVIGSWTSSEDEDRDLSFIRSLIWRIKNSDMDPRSKYLLIQRIRNYLDDRIDNSEEDRDLSFLRNLIDRIKNSNMNDVDKAKLYQRIRNYLASQGSDSSGDICSKDLSFMRTILERVKNSDMNDADRAKLYQRIRNYLSNYVEECSGDDENQSNSFLRDLIERIKNSDMNDADRAKLYQRIRNYLNSGHDDSANPGLSGSKSAGIEPISGSNVYPVTYPVGEIHSIENGDSLSGDDYFEDDDYFEVRYENDYSKKGIGTMKIDRDSVKSFSFSFGKK